ncbi:beta-glucosidase [Ameyamaea chiangmaiensis NBRC 103196]|uniref:Glycoside hydrolase family 3 C-terminal domain-containing protein n=1 Tax=Ameyamaea chiangmaiensis TaxID=442969 RepID=A0A850P8G6_9PROT|nr:glycoside hydrolase family 3 C-terminal domain-containing protein [Ameyamaea chiangmaiensis]MBS4074665.1 glycoside hydrolase family 3 C-terminal domain-containing protein [Ameyamaea chiangmaiensis]NVN40887.1 glycoside hydrolase family 3 C-terminal domain-containing protein [Ameyamaea chiangmaiensis]GBQ62291.1 beta-glucosidase [Ameyamaea chiangmaiensis NBRC 103196]
MINKRIGWLVSASLWLTFPAFAQDTTTDAERMAGSLSLEDQLDIVHSRAGGGFDSTSVPDGALGSAAFLKFPAHLHLPTLEYSDAGLGVGDPRNVRPHGVAVSLPSGLATASTWDTTMAEQGGRMIGHEAWQTGFNILLAGGANLTRDPRNGRNFEYAGEDPLLTGRIVGATIAGVQSQHVLSTIKHFALNDLETSRMTMSANMDAAAMRESDLLAFEIAIEIGHPGSVMCAYNRVNDLYACDSAYLLTKTLKQDWHYPGFVMSDWGADHTTARAALAGLDQESAGDAIDARLFFGPALADAVHDGVVPKDRLADMARRIIRSVYAVGLPSHPPVIGPVDERRDMATAQHDEEEGAVLLQNTHNVLPLRPNARILVVGGHADAGVLSGGGSSQVPAIGGNAVPVHDKTLPWPGAPVYFPDSPVKAMQSLTQGSITYDPGTDLQRAAYAARHADTVVVFATKWATESLDAPDLSLPDHQDALIAALAEANPHVVVVLETGNPVVMPWRDRVEGILEAWYPGSAGGRAIANLLYGRVNPSGHLPMTFPRSAAQLPRADIAGVKATTAFDVQFFTDQELFFREGSDVGYRWFDRQRQTPLFPFGYGLSYTDFQFSGFDVQTDARGLTVQLTVRNTGHMAGTAVPQIYISLPDGTARRLGGWQRVPLAAGESRTVTFSIEPRILAHFDANKDQWSIPAGAYTVRLAQDAFDNGRVQTVSLPALTMLP